MQKYILLERVYDIDLNESIRPIGIYTTLESLNKDYFNEKDKHEGCTLIDSRDNPMYGFSYFSQADNKTHSLEVYRVEDRQLYRHVEKTVSILWPILCTILFLVIISGAFNN